MTFLSRYAPALQSILRIVTGLLFLEHGTQKLLGFPPLSPAMAAMHVPDNVKTILLVAGIIELIGGALITLGLFSRWAAFICSGEMAIAFWLGHVGTSGVFFPATNMGDAAVLFCFAFLYLAAAGPGPYAVNQK
ncbi:MAG: DoxX family protein [Alphaproteobacteria bacterium]|nr:DoxX family protein [Alphaproteobacteria bacterium]